MAPEALNARGEIEAKNWTDLHYLPGSPARPLFVQLRSVSGVSPAERMEYLPFNTDGIR